jgi:NAD-dependent deacetylase
VHQPPSHPDPTIVAAARLLRGARAAVALSGAGISTPSGIPDFRSAGAGLWEAADPFVVASLSGFLRRPEAFYEWVRPLARAILAAQPNPAHVALAQLEAAGCLVAVITQNIDGLHQRAGSRCVHEVHGHLRTATCMRCGRQVATDDLIAAVVAGGAVPRCACGGTLKPDVVLFGDLLPVDVWAAAEAAVDACDVLLAVGSSLEVMPAAELPLRARHRGARLIIVNREPTGLDDLADVVVRGDVADVLPAVVEMVNLTPLPPLRKRRGGDPPSPRSGEGVGG